LLQNPNPGLYIQCIRPQKELPFDYLIQFNRQWTYVVLQKGLVYRSQKNETQRDLYVDYQQNIKFPSINVSNANIEKKLNSIKARFRPVLIHYSNSFIIHDIIDNLSKSTLSNMDTICQFKFSELIEKSIVLIQIVNDMLKESSSLNIAPDQIQIVMNVINVASKEELLTIVSIAELFDQKIHWKIDSQRRDVITNDIINIILFNKWITRH